MCFIQKLNILWNIMVKKILRIYVQFANWSFQYVTMINKIKKKAWQTFHFFSNHENSMIVSPFPLQLYHSKQWARSLYKIQFSPRVKEKEERTTELSKKYSSQRTNSLGFFFYCITIMQKKNWRVKKKK